LSRRKKRIFLIFGSASAVLVVMALIAYLEPFAPRYKGRTVIQWLDVIATNEERETSAFDVKAFGTNALPSLIAPNKLPFWRPNGYPIQRQPKAKCLSRIITLTWKESSQAPCKGCSPKWGRRALPTAIPIRLAHPFPDVLVSRYY
jgi:hypothetical protein